MKTNQQYIEEFVVKGGFDMSNLMEKLNKMITAVRTDSIQAAMDAVCKVAELYSSELEEIDKEIYTKLDSTEK